MISRDRDALEMQALQIGHGFDHALLAEALEGPFDPARLSDLGDAVARAEDAHRTAIGVDDEARRVIDDADIRDEAAQAVQEIATLEADLIAGAVRAIRTMLGGLAAEAALKRLVAERKGDMLEATQAAFRRLTGDAWDGLEAFGAGRQELVGLKGADRIYVQAMSEGTRAQLFLALRVAGHATFCRQAGPLPFVTDDILETFDDDRAGAALDMAAEMGLHGQVIFLTHHRHIAAMAERRIAGVRIVSMPAQAARGVAG